MIVYDQLPDSLRKVIAEDGQVLASREYQRRISASPEPPKIDFRLRNNSRKHIEAVVKGPKEYPFSYGFALSPRQKRKEAWPVGTKVYLVSKTGKTLLTTISAENAGAVVDLFSR